MQDQLRAVGIIASIAVIIFFTARGCLFCLEAFAKDKAGLWITVAEAMTAIAWMLVGLDVIVLASWPEIDRDITGTVFWAAVGLKLASTAVKSDKGFKVIRDTYRGLR